MCDRCDYPDLLTDAGVGLTPNRLEVLQVVGNNNCPLSAQDIFETLRRRSTINRVTVYRILDLLVARGLVHRISGGGRTAFYGLAPNANHRPHPHFYCKRCGHMECLSADSLRLDAGPLNRTFPGRIDAVQVCLDGVCKDCLK